MRYNGAGVACCSLISWLIVDCCRLCASNVVARTCTLALMIGKHFVQYYLQNEVESEMMRFLSHRLICMLEQPYINSANELEHLT